MLEGAEQGVLGKGNTFDFSLLPVMQWCIPKKDVRMGQSGVGRLS